MLQILTQSLNAAEINKAQIKDKDSKREEMHNPIYTGCSYKTIVVQSHCTSKGFHYNQS